MKIKIFASILIVFLIISTILFFWLKPYYIFATKTLNISIIKTLFSKDSLKTYDNQVNILVLGIPGETNDGPYLSDSIILANYNLENNQITTISIPRDIWSATLRDKINSAYAYGFAKNNKPEDGIKLAKAEVSSIVGQPIHYALVIDFSKFEQLIDFIGSIEVNVETAFTDNKFPIAGRENDDCGDDDPHYKCRYETVHFDKGLTKMDGATALKFVRSRHAEDQEGSNFAREKRQQKVIIALEKELIQLLQKSEVSNLDKLYQRLNQLVSRDLTNQQASIIGKNIIWKKIFKKRELTQKQITFPENFFIVPSYYEYDGKYVLIPKENGSFDKIHQYIKNKLEKKRKEN